MNTIIKQSFYACNTITVARELLGKQLFCHIDGILRGGIIIETEAYCSNNDLASHAFCGKTKRNAPMFGPVGRAYVYFIYGNHYCFNIVAKDKPADAGAVLIRAIKPTIGIEHIQNARGNKYMLKNLTNGPGKLTQALGINVSHNHVDLTQKETIWITDYHSIESSKIIATPRIGIKSATNYLWRFCLKNNL